MTTATEPTVDGPGRAVAVLGLRHVHKVFGGVHAVEDVSFDVRAGSVLALLGENGAGKSTCVKLLGGVYSPDSGEVVVDGETVVLRGPAAARARGIAVVSQHPELFPDLSLVENLFVGSLPTGRAGVIDTESMRARAIEALGLLGLDRDVDDLISGVSASEQQLVEIAKALVADARVLVLDEPTASLSSREVDRLFDVVERLRDRGVAIVFVGHRLEEIFRIADRVVVLRDGRLVGDRDLAGLTPSQTVTMMVGREVDLGARRTPLAIGDEVLRVEQLGRRDEFARVEFSVAVGEVLGIGGLVGSGRTEIARCIFGITRPDDGTIRLDGRPVAWDGPADAIAGGIAYLSEDRRGQSLILDFSILDNATLVVLDDVTVGGLVSERRSKELVGPELDRMRLRYRDFDQPVASLSGGNQQKVALAKWLSSNPRVLILDEPTQGIDVKTKSDVHQMIDALARRGLAIIVISSDLPELIAVADRVTVMREGEQVAVLEHDEISEESVIRAATDADAVGAPPANPLASTDAADATPDGTGRRAVPAWLRRRELGLVVAIVAFAGVITAINANFFSGPIQRNLARDVALLAILAVGEMFVIVTRNIDLSVSSIVGLTAYLSADFMRDHQGAPVVAALAVGLAVGALCGLFNGLVIAVGRVPSIVVTLGTLAVFRGITGWIAGTEQVSADQVPSSWPQFGRASIAGVPLFVPISLAVLLGAARVLRRRRFGREIYACGSNPIGARLAGVPLVRRVVQAYVISGALAGFVGAMTASRYATVDARVGVGIELTVVASAVVGGVALRGGSGTVLGVGLGALLLLVIQIGLPLARVDSLWLQGVYGLVILVAIAIDVAVDRAGSRVRGRRPVLGALAPIAEVSR